MKRKIGIIGFGNMGRAIGGQLKVDYEIYAFDKDKNKTKGIREIAVSESIEDVLTKAEVIVLAVKPQDFSALLDKIKDLARNKLIISIAAGVATSFVENRLDKVRVIRVMPNMPAKIGKGMSCLCRGNSATLADIALGKEIFKHLGETLILNEDKMDAATAVSGSGPAYFIECKGIENPENFTARLAKAAELTNLSAEEAATLSAATTAGSLAMLGAENITPLQLKERVTSKGGTTEAGLKALHRKGSLEDAVMAAWKRAKELKELNKGK